MHPSRFTILTGVTNQHGASAFRHLAPTLALMYDTVLLDTRLIPLALTLGDTSEWGREVGILVTHHGREGSLIAQSIHLARYYKQKSILSHLGFHDVETGTLTPVSVILTPHAVELEPEVFESPLRTYNHITQRHAEGVTLVCPFDPDFRPYFLEAQ